ncbi:hypothetical protein [Sulfitobacter sp.]|uniref:hypothetical protein n=1 Tax=Sulfitobacter sp. TaxID=1903071 RepID=UPI0032986763
MAAIALLALAACAPASPTAEDFIPEYKGVETALLDGDLVQFNVAMTKAMVPENVAAYAECAAAQYTLIRGYGFARHVRTNVAIEGGVWRADAVYTISPSLPKGLKTIDAEVVTENCRDKGIPTV